MVYKTCYKKGDKVIIDKDQCTENVVTVHKQTPLKLITTVCNEEGKKYDVMTNRLTPKS